MDGYVEECYWGVAVALERGHNCLAFDGPGQGGMLRQREVPFRPDWEAVVTPVLDFALKRTEVTVSVSPRGKELRRLCARAARAVERGVVRCVPPEAPEQLRAEMHR